MVLAHPELLRKFRNTNYIIKAGKSHLVSELYIRHPEDYINIQTHKTIEMVKPWAELPSSIARQTFGIMGSTIPSPIARETFGIMNGQQMNGQQNLQPITIDKILILCVDFSDKPAQIPIETIYSRFFGDYQNSLKEYYREVSHGRYIPHGELHGWYRVTHPSTYYTDKQNGFGIYPKSADRLVEEVLNIASNDPNIDWESFDTNNNGYIDNLIVIHSGAEAAYTGNLDDFWSHVYIIPTPKIIKQQQMSQEKTVWVYQLVPEYLDIPDNYRLVGIDSHEFGHLLGLPDLYDYSDNSNGVGLYSLMGGGSWALKGMVPVHLDAWSKHILGFSDPIIDPVGKISIENAETSPNNIIYTTTDPKEYFMVENRQKILYDKYLPSEGIFIWHVNENQKYNDNELCYLVGLIQADNFKDLENRANGGDLGDPYPGVSNNRSFSNDTNPNSVLCDGTIKKILINNISDSADIMTFNSTL
jgi:immune inhibitor A